MSGGNQQQYQNAATALIEYRLRLQGDKVPEGRKPPSLVIQVDNKNQVIIRCDTGIFGADQQQVSIAGKMGAYEFGILQIQAENIHKQEPGFQYRALRLYGPRKKRTPNDAGKGIDAVVIIGKDQQGNCYISCMRKDPPHIRFIFKPGQYAEMVDLKSNQPVPLNEVSDWYSQAWAKTLAPLVAYALNTKVYDFRNDPERQTNGGYQQRGGQGGGGGGGYNNNNGGGGGGYGQGGGQQQSAPAPAAESAGGWDDDIPL